jgi:hypothetical protein
MLRQRNDEVGLPWRKDDRVAGTDIDIGNLPTEHIGTRLLQLGGHGSLSVGIRTECVTIWFVEPAGEAGIVFPRRDPRRRPGRR